MQTKGVYGAQVSKTHIDGEVKELRVLINKVNAYRTAIVILDPGVGTIMSLQVLTPADHEVTQDNWVDVIKMMLESSPKGIGGSGHFERYTITSKSGSGNHAFTITDITGEKMWIILVEQPDNHILNALNRGMVFKNEDFFQGGGSLEDYDPLSLKYAVWYTPNAILFRVPSLQKMEPLKTHSGKSLEELGLPTKYVEFYDAQFKEPLSIREQINVHLRGINGYALTADMIKEYTPNGLTHTSTTGVYSAKGLILKQIGKEFFYLESHDGKVRVTIHKDPAITLISAIRPMIFDRWNAEWDKFKDIAEGAPEEFYHYHKLTRDFSSLAIKAMGKTSREDEAQTLNEIVDFYNDRLA